VQTKFSTVPGHISMYDIPFGQR